MNDLKLKFIISGILIAAIGLVLSHTYRPYVYENHINDFHLADVIGSVVCVPLLRYYALMALITDTQ